MMVRKHLKLGVVILPILLAGWLPGLPVGPAGIGPASAGWVAIGRGEPASGNLRVAAVPTEPSPERAEANAGLSGSERSFDKYGGLLAVKSPHGASNHFRVEKFGRRWVFVTPEGHPFWMLGVFAVEAAGDINSKCGGRSQWGIQATRRLRAWGFNTIAEYASAYVLPGQPGVERLPFMVLVRPSHYGLMNRDGLARAAFKDLVDTLGSAYTGWRGGNTPDVFDPNYEAYANRRALETLRDMFWSGLATSAWAIGITIDETDDLLGFGPGPEIKTDHLHPHIGWFAIAANPHWPSSAKWGQSYPDPKVHSKYKLQAMLQAKYATIAALNAAWGSNYTAWDSAGGYGRGSGFLDEDGRHKAWLGTTDGTLEGARPAVQEDLDAFLYEYAKQYFSVTSAAVRKHAPRQLVFGPASLNGWSGLTRKQILQAAGQYLDVLNASVGSQMVLEKTFQYAGDKPQVTWEGFVANPDSALFAYPNPPPGDSRAAKLSFDTQRERGQHYVDRLNFLVSGATASGVSTVAGIKFWGWTDSWGEKLNWGLTSLRENAYDGKEAVIAPGKDPWGYATGGEERNCGDFLSWVKAANWKVISDSCKQLRSHVSSEGGPSTDGKGYESDRKGKPQPPCPERFPQVE